MANVHQAILIIVVNANGTTTPLQSEDFQTGQKYKIQLYAIYKKLACNIKITCKLAVKGSNKIYHASTNQKKA